MSSVAVPLPAISLGGDASAYALGVLGRKADIAVGVTAPGSTDAAARELARARRMGMLTLALAGGETARVANVDAEYRFTVPSDDAMLVHEAQETLHRVLWELVHVFLEEPAARWRLDEHPRRRRVGVEPGPVQ